jgi:predicted dehydrogenase
MSRKVRIGFVGVGNMGQNAHLRNYASLPDCEVVALTEIRPGLAERVAQRYAISHTYSRVADMLANEELDGVIAIQQFNRHGSILPEIYAAGIPVLTEKPLGASLEVGQNLVAALEASGSWHMVGYHKRCDPAIIYAVDEIRRWQASGEYGALRYVRITMPEGDWIAGGFNDLVRSTESVPDEGTDPPDSEMDAQTFAQYVSFVNYYIHQVNLMRHLLGENYSVTHADKAGTLLVAESASGVSGVIEMSPYKTSVAWHESVLVGFERGYVKVDLPAPLAQNRPGRVEILRDLGRGNTPTTTVPDLAWEHAHRVQAQSFVRAIKGEIKPPCVAQEALQDLVIARDYMRLWKEKTN